MEYRKACPACEHTDPQLERELEALAQLLVESYLEGRGIPLHRHPSDTIDNGSGQGRLKEVDNLSNNDE